VISDIVSSPQPEEAARQLSEAFKRGIAGLSSGGRGGYAVLPTGIHRADGKGDEWRRRSKEDWLEGVVGLMKVVKEKKPLAHQVSPTSSILCLFAATIPLHRPDPSESV
jgi:hypothetical protein